ncbi:unnamed protein product [Pseudo-nitzschia multistriata]|uniref:Protein kinase domain-containing protein n=1 Tax=Pseudo-nitzschia multistriata TaxID=183589 RepID=A0A448YYV9_9STRA|nr:unnamed protein product [Pseudo-nitzschia multistriata]
MTSSIRGISTSTSGSTQRSLFQNSNEDRKKREEATLHKMKEVTRTYLDKMETNSAFFSDETKIAMLRRNKCRPIVIRDDDDYGKERENGGKHSHCIWNGGVVVPRFEPIEIELETTLGMGEFGTVLRVGSIHLLPRSQPDDDNCKGDRSTRNHKKEERPFSSVRSNPSVLVGLEPQGNGNNNELDTIECSSGHPGSIRHSEKRSLWSSTTMPSMSSLTSSSHSGSNTNADPDPDATIISKRMPPRSPGYPSLWLGINSSSVDEQKQQAQQIQSAIGADRLLRQELTESYCRPKRNRRHSSPAGGSSLARSTAISTNASLLVIKQIRKDLYPKKRIEAAKDLAREAKLLARLQLLYCTEQRSDSEADPPSDKDDGVHPFRYRYVAFDNHPNLITLRGIVSNPGAPDFGILLDRLHLTLAERVTFWGKRQNEILEKTTGRTKRHSYKTSLLASWWPSRAAFWPSGLFGCDKREPNHTRSSMSPFSQVVVGEDASLEGVMYTATTTVPSSPLESLVLLGERVLALFDVAEGMRYLHKHKIVFRDLKTENVGGKTTSGDALQRMQIFDFGLARECKSSDKVRQSPLSSRSVDSASRGEATPGFGDTNDNYDLNDFYDTYHITGMTGTMRIMAPEVIRYSPYGLPADVYSFGICMWEVFTGKKCNFLSAAEICDTKNVVRPRPPMRFDPLKGSVGMPLKLRVLMQKCWHEDPNQRPEFGVLSDHLRSILSELHNQSSHPERPFGQPSNAVDNGASSNNENKQRQPFHERSLSDGTSRSSGQAALWCRLEAIHASRRQDD